ncbi:maleylpyruvate isomerase family mycothiol-dependent enzyme [Tessaracoccus terricola]
MPSPLSVGDGAPDESVLQAVREQTHLLLGRTISYSEEDWAESTRLPGWSRSHVAAHLAANARDLVAACRALARGAGLVELPNSPAAEAHDLELGALDDGLTLQIALDTSAGALHDAMAELAPGDAVVRLKSGQEIPARLIPLVRLHEVILHQFDLASEVDDVVLEPSVANDLLAFQVSRMGADSLPRAHVLSHEGFDTRFGDGEVPRVTGPAADLVVWLARDVVSRRVGGAVPASPSD